MGIHGLCMDSLLQKQSPGQWIKNKKPLQSQIRWHMCFQTIGGSSNSLTLRANLLSDVAGRLLAYLVWEKRTWLAGAQIPSVAVRFQAQSQSSAGNFETSYWTCNTSRTLGQVLFAFQQVPPQCLKLKCVCLICVPFDWLLIQMLRVCEMMWVHDRCSRCLSVLLLSLISCNLL